MRVHPELRSRPLPPPAPLRLFLDAGVLIDGCTNRGGASKGVIILVARRQLFRAVIADPIDEEFKRNTGRKTASLPDAEKQIIIEGVAGWFRRARPERRPWPSRDEMMAHAHLLAAVRHRNDMPGVVAAVLARPDWILSTNTAHWNQELAALTGLRIATPDQFLASLRAYP